MIEAEEDLSGLVTHQSSQMGNSTSEILLFVGLKCSVSLPFDQFDSVYLRDVSRLMFACSFDLMTQSDNIKDNLMTEWH